MAALLVLYTAMAVATGLVAGLGLFNDALSLLKEREELDHLLVTNPILSCFVICTMATVLAPAYFFTIVSSHIHNKAVESLASKN